MCQLFEENHAIGPLRQLISVCHPLIGGDRAGTISFVQSDVRVMRLNLECSMWETLKISIFLYSIFFCEKFLKKSSIGSLNQTSFNVKIWQRHE